MITETIYTSYDLHSGVCEWCGEKSHELIYTDGGEKVCIDCIEAEKFYREIMNGI